VAHSLVSLVTLLADGPAALAPDPASGVLGMALSQVVYQWNNAFNETVIRQADDLFACAAREGLGAAPVPKGAEFTQATLDVLFVDCPQPHAVTLVRPDTVAFQAPEDAARLLPLLAQRGICDF
jgi:hypothetical protein